MGLARRVTMAINKSLVNNVNQNRFSNDIN